LRNCIHMVRGVAFVAGDLTLTMNNENDY